MKLSPGLLAVAACVATPFTASAVDTGVVGTWRGPENSVISISPCGETLCAKVLSTGNETAARVDTNNPNAGLRTRPLCGLQIGEGFHGSDPNKAEGGHLYDPRTGKTYKGSMMSQGDVLLLRGYIGVSMFGKTARWQRITTPVEMCSNAQPARRDVPPAPGDQKPAGDAIAPASSPAPTTTPTQANPPSPQVAPSTAPPMPATTPAADKAKPQ